MRASRQLVRRKQLYSARHVISQNHEEASRRAILEQAFHVDSRHPGRRVIFEVGYLLMPIFAVGFVVGVFVYL